MYDTSFDAVVIGSGPGGYVCAIHLAQLGLKTACIEKDEYLGGTCLNIGCIPSKALLHASSLYFNTKYNLSQYGVNTHNTTFDLGRMMQYKHNKILELSRGINFLFKKNKVTILHGKGIVEGSNQVILESTNNQRQIINAKYIVIATGSTTSDLPGIVRDGTYIISSTEALSLIKIPTTMMIIGAGVIGLELGSVFNRLGCEVTVLEYCNNIIPAMDIEVSQAMAKILIGQGIVFKLATKVNKAIVNSAQKHVAVEYTTRYEENSATAEKLLVAVGRKPHNSTIGKDIARDKHNRILVNERFETSIPNVFAIGDVIAGPMLAHKASDEGMAVARVIAKKPLIKSRYIPLVIYTDPEVAAIGATTTQLEQNDIPYKVGKVSFASNSRAKLFDVSDGFVKMLVCKHTDTILGVHIVGPQASLLINEIAVAMEYGASAEDLTYICHSHPDLSETIKEAALAAYFRAIHS